MLRILCIEDDAETRVLLRKSIEGSGMEVDTVWTGEKGVEAAMSGQFNCIVLDLIMPGMNGFQVIQSLKSQELTHDLPVVVLTGREDKQTRDRAMAAGADAYLIKPFDVNELVDSIKTLAERHQSAQKA